MTQSSGASPRLLRICLICRVCFVLLATSLITPAWAARSKPRSPQCGVRAQLTLALLDAPVATPVPALAVKPAPAAPLPKLAPKPELVLSDNVRRISVETHVADPLRPYFVRSSLWRNDHGLPVLVVDGKSLASSNPHLSYLLERQLKLHRIENQPLASLVLSEADHPHLLIELEGLAREWKKLPRPSNSGDLPYADFFRQTQIYAELERFARQSGHTIGSVTAEHHQTRSLANLLAETRHQDPHSLDWLMQRARSHMIHAHDQIPSGFTFRIHLKSN